MFARSVSLRRTAAVLIPAVAALLIFGGAAAAGRRIFRPVVPANPDCPCPNAPAPEDAIRQVLDAQVAAWNRGDLDAFMDGYWRSPNLTFFSGPDKESGWQATIERYRRRYQSDGKEMGKLTFSELSVETLGPDAALVRGRWSVEMSKETLGGLFTLIFRRTPDGWRIIHDHTSK